jgi:hypothetical protein
MLVRNGTWRRGDATPFPGAEAVAPAADGDAQPDTAAVSDTTTALPNDVSAPALGC